MSAYGKLVSLLPAPLRSAYGAEMRQTYGDMCAQARRTRGRWGVVAVRTRCLVDLGIGVAWEWMAVFAGAARTTGRCPHRIAATTVTGLAVGALLTSVARYPATLGGAGHARWLIAITLSLLVVGVFFLTAPGVPPHAVYCGLASVPVWMAAFYTTGPMALVLALALTIVLASVGVRQRRPIVAVRLGAVAGLLAGIALLDLNLVDGLITMPTLLHNATYVKEFARVGGSSTAAYIIGERTAGGAYAVGFGLVAGALLGAAGRGVDGIVRAVRLARASSSDGP